MPEERKDPVQSHEMISAPGPGAAEQPGLSFLQAADRVLYPPTLAFTAAALAFVLAEFATGGRWQARFPITDVYLALLGAYAAEREAGKWMGAEEAAKRLVRGEIFVGIWFALYLFVICLANINNRFSLPVELKPITLGVLGIFAATGVSRGVRSARGGTRRSREQQVLDLVAARGTASGAEVAEGLGIGRTTAWRLLEHL